MTDQDFVDIVTLLRSPDRFEPHTCNAAADEIERLRVIVQGWQHSARNAERDIETLRAERDEARRRLCFELFEVEGLPFGWTGARGAEGIAERLGWDCFKGDGK